MKVKNYFAAACCIALLAACSNNEEVPGQDGNNGEAYVGLNLTLPASAFSKAADVDDTNADETETAVKTITVYGQAQTPGAALTKLTDLTTSDFTKSGSSYVMSDAAKAVKVQGADGTQMNIYVVLNNSDDLSTELGTPLTAYTAGASVTAKSNEFLMSSATPGVATMKAAPADAIQAANKADVTVERAAAKVLVKASTNFDITETSIADAGQTGNFDATTLCWTVGNSPKELYVRKNNDNGTVKTPDWTHVATNSWSYYNTKYDLLSDAQGVVTADPTIPVMPNTVIGDDANTGVGYVGYCNENTHDIYVVGNTSYVLIMAQFTPTKVYTDLTGTGAGMTGTESTAVDKATFYYHNATGMYVTEDAYTAYTTANAAETGAFVGPYTDGKCYYRVPVWDITSDVTKAKGTERNTFYTLSIKSLTAPGFPIDPTYPDSEKPNEDVDVYIGVDVTIAPWALHSMGDDIDLK